MFRHQIVVSGDKVAAQQTMITTLEGIGFEVDREETPKRGDFWIRAKHGSRMKSFALGALAGKEGQFVWLNIVRGPDDSGNYLFDLQELTAGSTGGLIGMHQAKEVYEHVFESLDAAYQEAGTLVSSMKR